MIQRAEQANIVGLRSKDFVQWVEQNIDAPMKRGPGGAVLERLKGGLVGEFFNWAKRNSTWPLHFGIRSEEHTSEFQSQSNLVCRLLLEKKKKLDALTVHSVKTRKSCRDYR